MDADVNEKFQGIDLEDALTIASYRGVRWWISTRRPLLCLFRTDASESLCAALDIVTLRDGRYVSGPLFDAGCDRAKGVPLFTHAAMSHKAKTLVPEFFK